MIFTQHHITRNTASMLNFTDRVKLFQWNFDGTKRLLFFKNSKALKKVKNFKVISSTSRTCTNPFVQQLLHTYRFQQANQQILQCL